MADTIRDRATLLALLPDNTTAQISPQDLRDVLVTVHGVYGMISVDGGAVAQTVNIAASKLTAFAVNGDSAGTTPNQASDEVMVLTTGEYRVSCQISFSGTAARTVHAQLRKNAATVTGAAARRKINATGDATSMKFETLVSCAANDLLSVYIDADVDGSSITVIDGQLVVHRVA